MHALPAAALHQSSLPVAPSMQTALDLCLCRLEPRWPRAKARPGGSISCCQAAGERQDLAAQRACSTFPHTHMTLHSIIRCSCCTSVQVPSALPSCLQLSVVTNRRKGAMAPQAGTESMRRAVNGRRCAGGRAHGVRCLLQAGRPGATCAQVLGEGDSKASRLWRAAPGVLPCGWDAPGCFQAAQPPCRATSEKGGACSQGPHRATRPASLSHWSADLTSSIIFFSGVTCGRGMNRGRGHSQGDAAEGRTASQRVARRCGAFHSKHSATAAGAPPSNQWAERGA